MIQVSLSEQTVEKLRLAAAARGADISELLDQVIEQYLANESALQGKPREKAKDERLELIEREQAAYEAQHSRLLETYAGQYIAMWQGQVVDHDADRTALGRRVRARYGDEPILITPVHREARQTMVVRSPRLSEKTT